MEEGRLVDYLVRVALDDGFQQLALADPEQSFAGYALSDADRRVIGAGDAGVLALIGRAVREQLGIAAPPPAVDDPFADAGSVEGPGPAADAAEPAVTPAPTPAGHALPEMALMVRLAPFAEGAAGVDLKVSYVASLQPVPHPALVDDVTLVPVDAPSEAAFGHQPRSAADITIVGLGMAAPQHLTREAERALRDATEVLYLDTGVATPALLAELANRVTPLFADSYVEDAARLDAYRSMAARVVDAATDHPPVVFALHGHPVVGVHPPFAVAALARERGLSVRVVPGISALDCLFADLGLDPVVHGMQMFEATDLLLRRRPLQPDVPLVIWQAGNVETRLHTSRRSHPARFERLEAHLLRFYPQEHPLTIYFAPPHPLVPVMKDVVAVGDLRSRADELHPGVTLYVPPAFERPIVDAELLALVDDPDHLRRITH